MSHVKKRTCLSVDVKKNILKEVDDKILSKTEIAKKFGIPKNSLSTILKQREKITEAETGSCSIVHSRKYFRESKYPDLEKALLAWLRKMRNKDIPVDGNLLKEQANYFASKLGYKDFKASDGWQQKFKLRNGLSFRKICGESKAADTAAANKWKEDKGKSLLSEYAAEDIFNADETGLFFKVLPDRTLAFKGDTCAGGKKAKQRLSILIAANMTGSQKLPLLFIGKFLKPRCFKNVFKLPAAYYANAKAWMTGQIYEKWLRDLDRQMLEQKRKVLLIVDNCTAHVEVCGLQAIRVEFMPANVSSILQPMDQGVINSFKRKYRSVLLQRVILGMEIERPYEIDVLGAMHLAISAWNDVTATTITNAFKHAGFIKEMNKPSADIEEIAPDFSKDEILMKDLLQRTEQLQELSFDDFLNVDDNLICTEEISDEDIISSVITENLESPSDEDVENEVPRPSVKQASEWLSGLRRFFEGHNNREMLTNIDKMESCIFQDVVLKQTKINDYFSV